MSEQSAAETYRNWIGIGLNILFLPVLLTLEIVHYGLYRDWLAHSPKELVAEASRPVDTDTERGESG